MFQKPGAVLGYFSEIFSVNSASSIEKQALPPPPPQIDPHRPLWGRSSPKRPLSGLDEYQNLTPTFSLTQIDPLRQRVYFWVDLTESCKNRESILSILRLRPCIDYKLKIWKPARITS